MKITRRFVPEGTDPFSMFEYEKHHCLIKHHVTGKVQCDYTAEVPKHWSVNAKNIAISKYFRKGGVPGTTSTYLPHGYDSNSLPIWLRPATAAVSVTGGETSIRQVIHRIVGHWAYTGFVNGYFDEASAHAYYDENVYILLKQMAAPNSPQWFNTGLWWAYGITGPKQGHWYADESHNTKNFKKTPPELRRPVATKESPNAYERVQAHACFILTLDDTMFNGETGIFEWYSAEGRIFKYGSGSGVNASNLRGTGERLSGGGKSSGLMSWLKVCDYSAGAIKSGGTTRRAAKMVCLDIDHPDIEEFIRCKTKAEIAAASLVTGSAVISEMCQTIIDRVRAHAATYSPDKPDQDVLEAMRDAATAKVPHNYIKKAEQLALLGYDKWPATPYNTEFEGEAYATVPFQNANHSVRLTHQFYKACDAGDLWFTKYRTDPMVTKEYKARDLEWMIASEAWYSGDPGVQYHTNINDWNVTPNDGEIRASNPCSEHMRLDDSACNLASIKLMAFLGDDHSFMLQDFIHVIRLYQLTLDITVTMAHLPTRRVAENVFNYRDTGLGYCDLGALIMSLGIAYDSDQARALAAAITAMMQAHCHMVSAELAQSLGPYPRFWANKKQHIQRVENHIAALGDQEYEFVGLTNPPKRIDWEKIKDIIDVETWYTEADDTFCTSVVLAEENGYRNAQMSVLAPTGTISLIMDCDTTGVEPMLGLSVMKTLAGGGKMELAPARALTMGLKKLLDVSGGCGQIAANQIIDGTVAINVFDTSFPHAKTKRAIRWEAHVLMMAAVQPFLSGAISKTINMPADSTIEDIRLAYRMGNDLGLKSLAVYRDGCKLSQPLNIPGIEDIIPAQESATAIQSHMSTALSPDIPAGGRMLLGWQRNPGIDIKTKIGGGSLYLRTTRYPDGKCAEIWATYSSDQGIVSALLGTVCRTANRMLQWGIPLEEVIDIWRDTNFEPRGFIGEHPYIKTATSILNLISRLLDYHELGNTGALNIQPNARLGQTDADAVSAAIEKEPGTYDRVKITGETCPNCGSQQYVISGANCKKCLQCGSAGGCG